MAEGPEDVRTTDRNRVSTLELFFDLVFVFTVTQLALTVEHHPSWGSVAQAGLVLLVIYWMYSGYAWLTNSLGTSTNAARAVLLSGMAAFLIVSLAVPRALETDAIAFAWAYLVLNLVHMGGFVLGGGRNAAAMRVVAPANLAACALIVAAAYVEGSWRWALWVAAVVVQWAPPLVSRATQSFDIGVEHFAERHGLMIIIVLGESLVSVAVAAQSIPISVVLVVGVLCGLGASAAMWWCYFAGDDERAMRRLAAASLARRGRLALVGYDLPHVLMMAGIVGVAAGSRLSLPELTAPTDVAAASLIAGGAAVYLAGLAAFRVIVGYGRALPRLAAGALMPAVIPLGTHLGAAQELLAVAVVIVVLLVLEAATAVRARPQRGIGQDVPHD